MELRAQCPSPLPPSLLSLFQKGLEVEVELGADLQSLLGEDLRLSEEGIAKIQTIFWQGRPVDDLQSCLVEEGGVLALSAALPGVVGACFRREGAWAKLRSSITHKGDEAVGERRRGIITVKLFNFMLRELGPMLFARGVRVELKTLLPILAENLPAAKLGLEQKTVDLKALYGVDEKQKLVFICTATA